ncbi:hypothetical protein VNO77_18314 [Canavalia gladiata]|uniref:soluble epoxide hydrolase n=1 Tax=Canavalia gladiata TaxID=3824 RepID=A0AAN9QNK4_CANGL
MTDHKNRQRSSVLVSVLVNDISPLWAGFSTSKVHFCHSVYVRLELEKRLTEKMEGIQHRTVEVNGIKMHVAEKGEGPVVLFIHGFPELWYSWRHQIVALSSLGYRAVAPDLRGYGDTDAPSSVSSYTCFHLVGDIVALIDSLGVDQVYLVAHDWGAMLGWALCQFRPERIKAYVCLSVPFWRRNPKVKPVDGMRALYGDDYYICRFQKEGEAEADFAKFKTEQLIKTFLTGRKPGPPIFPKRGSLTDINPDSTKPLPTWLTQEDLNYYASKFEKTGFTGGLNYYRNLNLLLALTFKLCLYFRHFAFNKTCSHLNICNLQHQR